MSADTELIDPLTAILLIKLRAGAGCYPPFHLASPVLLEKGDFYKNI